MKLKVETTAKERDKQPLDFITIDALNIEHQHLSGQNHHSTHDPNHQ